MYPAFRKVSNQAPLFHMISAFKIDCEFMHRIAQVSSQSRHKAYNKAYHSETLHFSLTLHYFSFFTPCLFKEQV